MLCRGSRPRTNPTEGLQTGSGDLRSRIPARPAGRAKEWQSVQMFVERYSWRDRCRIAAGMPLLQRRIRLAIAVGVLLGVVSSRAANPSPERVYLDPQGVVRWVADHREVALFGANYSLPSACDYRAAGYIHADRKKLIEKDMAHFARMGWDGCGCAFGAIGRTRTSRAT